LWETKKAILLLWEALHEMMEWKPGVEQEWTGWETFKLGASALFAGHVIVMASIGLL